MRYTEVLGRIMLAADNLKIDGANVNFPEAVRTQIMMWKFMLEDYYSDAEILKFQASLMRYLEV